MPRIRQIYWGRTPYGQHAADSALTQVSPVMSRRMRRCPKLQTNRPADQAHETIGRRLSERIPQAEIEVMT
jgi:hypothetical protein